jgi:hypothetical protein
VGGEGSKCVGVINSMSNSMTSSTVSPSVSRPGELVRQLTPSSLSCRVGCGENCRHEQRNFQNNQNRKSISDSISANWVHQGEIVAMARPSEEYISSLLRDLSSLGINSILNVQELEEHSYCGKILSSGFTYLPETVMKSGLTFYNFPAPDFGIWDPAMLFQIVTVVEFAVTEGAVAIHCHAGLGRTGVVCAAYLVYTKGLTGDEANRIVRNNRPGSIQTRQQLQSVLDFELFLKNRRKWPKVNSTGNDSGNSANSGKTWEELAKLQNQTAPKQSKLRKKCGALLVPYFLDFCFEIVKNREFCGSNQFNLEKWLWPDRIKNGFWPILRLLTPDQIGEIVIEWLFALGEPLIQGAGTYDVISYINYDSYI